MNKERKASGGGIRGERVLEGGEKGLLRGNKGRKGSGEGIRGERALEGE